MAQPTGFFCYTPLGVSHLWMSASGSGPL